MSIFDPEILFRKLVNAVGLQPEQVAGAINLVLSEVQILQSERDAFKRGAAGMVAHYNRRLDDVDRRLERIEALLATIAAELPHNGKAIEHDGEQRTI